MISLRIFLLCASAGALAACTTTSPNPLAANHPASPSALETPASKASEALDLSVAAGEMGPSRPVGAESKPAEDMKSMEMPGMNMGGDHQQSASSPATTQVAA